MRGNSADREKRYIDRAGHVPGAINRASARVHAGCHPRGARGHTPCVNSAGDANL